jgi:hypothetical protein
MLNGYLKNSTAQDTISLPFKSISTVYTIIGIKYFTFVSVISWVLSRSFEGTNFSLRNTHTHTKHGHSKQDSAEHDTHNTPSSTTQQELPASLRLVLQQALEGKSPLCSCDVVISPVPQDMYYYLTHFSLSLSLSHQS